MSGNAQRSIIVITHVDQADTSAIEAYAQHRNLTVRVVRPYRGESLPGPAITDLVLCLGGPMSARDASPVLGAEMAYLRDAVDADVPVVGICLGSQLLAQALGGSTRVGEHGPECGYIEVRGSGDDPDFFTGRFFSFHRDTMDPPPQATVLAHSDRYIQAWSHGSALGIQYHPELSADGMKAFFDIEADIIASIGLDTDQCLNEQALGSDDVDAHLATLLDHWFAKRPLSQLRASNRRG